MRLSIAAFVVLFTVTLAGAAPKAKPATAPAATRPTTRSSTGQRLAAEVESARNAAAAAERACLDRLGVNPEYRAAVADETAKASALQAARAGADAQAKVAAGASWTKARDRLAKLRAESLAADVEVGTARAKLADVVAELASTDRTDVERERADAAAAAKEQELLSGPARSELKDRDAVKDGSTARLRLKVVRIEDDQNALVEAEFYSQIEVPIPGAPSGSLGEIREQHAATPFWLSSFPTSGYLDGDRIEITVTFKGTKRAGQTIPLGRPYKLDQQRVRVWSKDGTERQFDPRSQPPAQ